MRRLLQTAALLGTLSLSSAPVQADVPWLGFGPRFHVGAAHFVLVFGQPGLSYPRAHYYRTTHALTAHGSRCSSACFHSGPVFYHHDGCPLVRAHFVRFGYDPYDVYSRYAPRGDRDGRAYLYDDHDSRGYDRDDRYGRYDRDERYDAYRYNRYGSGGYYSGQGGFVIQLGIPFPGRGHGRYDHRSHDRHDGRGHGRYDDRGRDRHDGRGQGHYDNRGQGDRGHRGNASRNDHHRSNRNDSGRGRHNGRSSGSRR